jgi:outer membrane protein assembly factor BamB
MRVRFLIPLIGPLLMASSSHRAGPGRCEWSQWGQSSAHDGQVCAAGQPTEGILARMTVDPFVDDDGDPLLGPLDHQQVPLSDDEGHVFVMRKTGVSGDPTSIVWTERGLRWHRGSLEERWSFASDWKPAPLSTRGKALFQPALTARFLYIPGAGGTLFKVDKRNGHVKDRIRPFPGPIDPQRYVVGGVTADRDGNVYYNVVKVDPLAPLTADVLEAWLVKVTPRGHVRKADYTGLIPGAPAPADPCFLTFNDAVPRPPRPWPPPPQPDGSPTLPPQRACLSQRPALDATPAVGRDGTIFAVTRAHGAVNYSYLLALRPDLRLKWAASLREQLHDGCGFEAEPACRPGATPGVDPATNLPPAGQAADGSSSSPVALPDGGVVYGALTLYNGLRGHLMKFDREGDFVASSIFGWDITPALYRHDGTYSLVLKDNYYFDGVFFITQLDADLNVEWQYEATNTQSCRRLPDGTLECEEFGATFEWCISAPAVDRQGIVYGTSADGFLYVIEQGGAERGRFFLDQTAFAAYTPTAIDPEGRIYAMNNGELFVIGRATGGETPDVEFSGR